MSASETPYLSLSSANSEKTHRRYEVETMRDVRIQTEEPGVTLSADVFRPVGADVVPAVVTVLPYRKDASAGITSSGYLRDFASHGFAGVLVDLRGTGASDGRIRPPFDPADADDGVAAVKWAAEQEWCSGAVGMLGHSYGAVMAMRTAGRQPHPLKAIMPVMGMLDPERDFVHPGGRRGCLGSLAAWGAETLLDQLLPPLTGYGSECDQQRWRDRLDDEPWIMNLFAHGPGAAAWRSRTVDTSLIWTPSWFIAGWHDLFCEATIRAYEQSAGPKKLLVGPWMHTMPGMAPCAPIDVCALTLPWWEYWLRGTSNRVMDEPPVTVYVQGESVWRHLSAWPPPRRDLPYLAEQKGELRPARSGPGPQRARDRGARALAVLRPDPTVGSLSGLWLMPTTGQGSSVDQHDDDMRSLSFTSDPLLCDITIAGQPMATLRFTGPPVPHFLVVRLTDVDRYGRSTQITSGSVVLTDPTRTTQVSLTPTCYQLPRGHRLRMVLSTADLPRSWPLSAHECGGDAAPLAELALSVPTLSRETASGSVALLAPASDPSTALIRHEPQWMVARNLIHDAVEVTYGQHLAAPTSGHHWLETRSAMALRVAKANPAAADVSGTSTARVQLSAGETIEAHVELQLTRTYLNVSGQVTINGTTVFSRRWEA